MPSQQANFLELRQREVRRNRVRRTSENSVKAKFVFWAFSEVRVRKGGSMKTGTKRWITVGTVVALAVAVWLLLGPHLIFSPLEAESPLVRNGVAAVMVCGGQSNFETGYEAMDYVPRPKSGTWQVERKGECTVWFHLQSGE